MQEESVHTIILNDLKSISEDIKDLISPLDGTTVLVAGGNGFIGKYFVNTLLYLNKNYLKNPCKIIVLDKSLNLNKPEFISEENLKVVQTDISGNFTIDEKLDFIIHTAGIASPVIYRKYPLQTILVSVYGTKNLLDIAKRDNVESFLYLSSSEVYGDPIPDQIPTKEDYRGNVSCTGPRASYDESKRLAETLCMTYFREFGTPIKIARPFNVYGPGLHPNDGRVVSDFVKNTLVKNEIILYSDGKPTRSFCYISDAIKGFFRILLSNHNGNFFNVGNDEEIAMIDVAKLIQSKIPNLKIKFEVHYDKDYIVDNPQRRCPDLTKVKNMTGYIPSVKLSTGLDFMLNWYRYLLNVGS